jgi:hypothetical protein
VIRVGDLYQNPQGHGVLEVVSIGCPEHRSVSAARMVLEPVDWTGITPRVLAMVTLRCCHCDLAVVVTLALRERRDGDPPPIADLPPAAPEGTE